MKTKSLLLLCLFMGIGLTHLSAQNGKNGTGAVPYNFVWDGYYVDAPVNCGDVTVDRLSGIADLHIVDHYKGGVLTGHTVTYRGEVKSLLTDEIFVLKDSYKWDASEIIGYGHCNLIGNRGTHYILSYSYDWTTDIFTFLKAVCP